jgi:hypothetical protein
MTEPQGCVKAWEDRYRDGRTAWDRGSVSAALLHSIDEHLVPAGVACVLARR